MLLRDHDVNMNRKSSNLKICKEIRLHGIPVKLRPYLLDYVVYRLFQEHSKAED